MTNIQVGSTIFYYDGNHRVYRRDENGRAIGGPIWAKHWVPQEVVAETRVSWVLRNGLKVNKKAPGTNFAFSQEEIDRRFWAMRASYKMADIIKHTTDYDTLKKIAAIINYSE